jgi:hypothetical protein
VILDILSFPATVIQESSDLVGCQREAGRNETQTAGEID